MTDTHEDRAAAIYKWGGPWPSETAETKTEVELESMSMLICWKLKKLPVQILPGVDYKFVDRDGNEITREEWEERNGPSKEEASSEGSGTSVERDFHRDAHYGAESFGEGAPDVQGDDRTPTP